MCNRAAGSRGSLLSILLFALCCHLAESLDYIVTGDPSTPYLLVLGPEDTFPVWNVTGGGQLELQNVVIKDSSTLQPDTSSGDLESLLSLPWVGAIGKAANVTIRNVLFSTSCSVVESLQQLACSSLHWGQLGSLEVLPGWLSVQRWTAPNLTVDHLTFSCVGNTSSLPADTGAGPDGAADPPAHLCAVGHVSNWPTLEVASVVLQQWADKVVIVLDSNLTVPHDTEVRGQPIPVYRPMRVMGQPGGSGNQLLYMNLGFIKGEGLWELHDGGKLWFDGITFPTLPLGPAEKFPMSLFPWGMWNVRMDRCINSTRSLVLHNCTLITTSETMDYFSYWAAEYLSVFPDRQQAAAWYGKDPTCVPEQDRTLLNQQIKLRDQHTWLAENATSLNVNLLSTTITSTIPPGLGSGAPGLQLTNIFEDPHLPFPEVTWVLDAPSFVQALQQQSTQYIAVLANISIAPELWPAQPILLSRDMEVAGWGPNRNTVINWNGVKKVLDLEKHILKMRNLVLMNGGQGGADAQPAWAANLTMYQWPVMYDWADTSLQLSHVMMVVPPSELDILRAHSHSSSSSSNNDSDPGSQPVGSPMYYPGYLHKLVWVQTANCSGQQCSAPVMAEAGISGENVTITSTPLSYPLIQRDVVLAADPSPRASSGGGRGSRGKLVLPIVLPLALGVTALAALATWVLRRRQQQQHGQSSQSKQQQLEAGTVERGVGPEAMPPGSRTDGAGLGGQPESQHVINMPAGQVLNNPLHVAHPQHLPLPGVATPGTLPWAMGPPSAPLTYVLPAALVHSGGQQRSHSGPPTSYVIGQPHSASGPDSAVSDVGALGAGLAQGHGRWPPQANGNGNGLTQGVSQVSEGMDSFEAPADPGALLINRLQMSRDFESHAPQTSQHDVASQLKSLVSRMQEELGDQDVHITRVLGQGGGGVVYQGVWRGLTVAVKSLVFTVLPDQPIGRHQQRAMTEAAICRTLHHPNIVATYAYDLQALHAMRRGHSNNSGGLPSSNLSNWHHHQTGVTTPPRSHGSHGHDPDASGPHEYKLYIIQEYCDGGTLRSLIDDGKLSTPPPAQQGQATDASLASILQLAVDVATGMAHVHDRSIVHGDLTPANILLRYNQEAASTYTAKVSDFGLSWKLARGQEHISNARQGTSFYISPEVLHVGIMSKAADVWSFGIILHEMYHGTPAWRRKQRLSSDAAVAMSRPGLEQLQWSPACPTALHALICSCLAADPKARPTFSNIAAMLRALFMQLLGGAPASALALQEHDSSGSMTLVPSLNTLHLPSMGFHSLHSGSLPAAQLPTSPTGRGGPLPPHRQPGATGHALHGSGPLLPLAAALAPVHDSSSHGSPPFITPLMLSPPAADDPASPVARNTSEILLATSDTLPSACGVVTGSAPGTPTIPAGLLGSLGAAPAAALKQQQQQGPAAAGQQVGGLAHPAWPAQATAGASSGSGDVGPHVYRSASAASLPPPLDVNSMPSLCMTGLALSPVVPSPGQAAAVEVQPGASDLAKLPAPSNAAASHGTLGSPGIVRLVLDGEQQGQEPLQANHKPAAAAQAADTQFSFPQPHVPAQPQPHASPSLLVQHGQGKPGQPPLVAAVLAESGGAHMGGGVKRAAPPTFLTPPQYSAASELLPESLPHLKAQKGSHNDPDPAQWFHSALVSPIPEEQQDTARLCGPSSAPIPSNAALSSMVQEPSTQTLTPQHSSSSQAFVGHSARLNALEDQD